MADGLLHGSYCPRSWVSPFAESRDRGQVLLILCQCGIYPSETFTGAQKCGLSLLVTTNLELIKYLSSVVEQLKDWLSLRKPSRVKSAQGYFYFGKIVYFNDLIPSLGSFDLLIYTDKDLVVPEKWEDTEEVHLGSFTTRIHKINSMVTYKLPVND
uniref:Uncharacterized protein n=1 Tax=Urocitellus parryii TaxID=9999 RepID=A0A8D2H1E8_UROPR